MPHLAAASVNMIGKGRDLLRFHKRRQVVYTPSFSSPDLDYNPGLGQVLVEQEGVFQGTRSRIVKPYNYGQPSSSEVMFPELLKYHFQWFNDEEEASG